MGWIIDVQGAQLRESEVMAAHVSVANATLGESGWDILDPMSSPSALVVWCALAVSQMTEKPLDESLMFIQNMPIQEVISYFHADEGEYVPQYVTTDDVPADPVDIDEVRARQRRFIEQATAQARQG